MNNTETILRDSLALNNKTGNKNYSVIAGAGAGKTTMLSNRIANQIIDGSAIESFVIITYTNAAANELRDKLVKELNERLHDEDLSLTETQNSNIKNALLNIDMIKISTIHSFLLDILKEYAFETKMALDVQMLEDDEDLERKEAFFNLRYKSLAADIKEKFGDDWIKQINNKPKNLTRDVFLNMFLQLANVREEIVYSSQISQDTIDCYADEFVRTFWTKDGVGDFKEFAYHVCPNKKPTKPVQIILDCRNELDSVTGKFTEENAKSISVAMENAHTRINASLGNSKTNLEQSFYGSNAKGNNPDDELQPYFKNVPAKPKDVSWDKFKEKFIDNVDNVNKLAKYVKDNFIEDYQNLIDKDTRFISNDDILFRSFKFLEKNPQILDKLRAKFLKIYVDEFQDTTDVQAKIVAMLATEPGTDYKDFKLKENNLIVVGDPKQSIYRFTGAEIAVYDQINNQFNELNSKIGEAVVLEQNFRSTSTIIDWVNKTFSKVMPNYESMTTDWKLNNPACLNGVFRCSDSPDYNNNKDASNVAEIILKLVNNDKYLIEKFDYKTQSYSYRKINFSDFMVITKGKYNLDTYLKAFMDADIPVNLMGKVTIGNDVVAKNFIRLVNYFANRKCDNAKLVAAQIVNRIDASDGDESAINASLAKLSEIDKTISDEHLDVAAIVYYLLNQEDLYLPLKLDTFYDAANGKYEIKEITTYRIHLHQMIETCLEKFAGDLKDFVSEMNKFLETEINRQNPLERANDAIRLMNVHQSKGLTGNIVIIADRCSEDKVRFDAFKSNGKFYPAASYKLNENQSAKVFPSFTSDISMKQFASDGESEEFVRLEYVAATRAANALIIMPVCSNKQNIWFEDVKEDLDECQEIFDWIENAKAPVGENIEEVSKEQALGTVSLSDLSNVYKTYDKDKFAVSSLDKANPSSFEKSIANNKAKKKEKDKCSIEEKIELPFNEEICANDELERDIGKDYSREHAGSISIYTIDSDPEANSRPKGDVFGNVLHRSFEILFNNYEELKGLEQEALEQEIKRTVNRAVLEFFDDLHSNDNPADFFTYLSEKLIEYFPKIIVPIMEDAKEIFPELSFSYYVPNDEIEQFKAKFNPYLPKNKQLTADSIWVNGAADLVVKKNNGNIKVYDYKSDTFKPDQETIDEFEERLYAKYKGQQELYKYTMQQIFGKDATIEDYELIHLYR
ncbi:MAG: UvrD-helicase domain-containing protein [Coriobacteriales bacterium]|nr:UvrD-helicase domain-containing protein [Coriobacteriales bacterium]